MKQRADLSFNKIKTEVARIGIAQQKETLMQT